MKEKELIERFAALISKGNSFHVGKVEAVTGLNCTIKPDNGDVEFTGVKLSLVDNPDLLIVPEVGSYVIFAERPINKSEKQYFILYCTRAQSMKINGDQYGGLVKVESLTGRLNVVENKLNDLIGKWNYLANNYVPGSPTTVGAPSTLLTETEVTNTEVSDIENNTIKHG